MGNFWGVLSVILVFGGLIFFHELGHFLVAKAFGIGVKTFSLGFGPRLFGFTRGQTEYQLAALPLGGFVSLVGEQEPDDIPEPFDQSHSLSLRPAWQRLLVIAAGPACNLFLAWLLYVLLFASQGDTFLRPQIANLQPGMPAASAGFEPGDLIRAIDGREITRWEELLEAVTTSQGRELVMDLDRKGRLVTVRVSPAPVERTSIFGEAQTTWGIGVESAGNYGHRPLGLGEAGVLAFTHSWDMVKLIGQSVVKMVERVVPVDQVGGPIQIVKEIHNQARTTGVVGVILIAAFISLNLGLLNLLPIPVLDGGHILFLLIEMVAGRPVPDRIMNVTTQIGMILLIGLMVFATVNDISRLAGSAS